MPGPALISEEHLCVGVILPAVLLRKAFVYPSAKLDASWLCVFAQKYMPANKHSWKPGYLSSTMSSIKWYCTSQLGSGYALAPLCTAPSPSDPG